MSRLPSCPRLSVDIQIRWQVITEPKLDEEALGILNSQLFP